MHHQAACVADVHGRCQQQCQRLVFQVFWGIRTLLCGEDGMHQLLNISV
jgi:hypothetical protein